MSTGWNGTRRREILEDVHDDANDALRVTVSGVDVNVTAVTDSIKIGDEDGKYVTITTVGGKDALDVNVADITLSHTDDSVTIGDGTQTATISTVSGKKGLDVNVLNDLTVNVTPAPAGATVTLFDSEVIAIGATATVVTYTAPASPTRYVQKLYLSSTQVGTFEIKKNATTLYKIRMSHTQFFYTIDVATSSAYGIILNSGDAITVTATNDSTASGTYDATIQFMEVV